MIRKIGKNNSTYSPIPCDTIQDERIEHRSEYEENMRMKKKMEKKLKTGLVAGNGGKYD